MAFMAAPLAALFTGGGAAAGASALGAGGSALAGAVPAAAGGATGIGSALGGGGGLGSLMSVVPEMGSAFGGAEGAGGLQSLMSMTGGTPGGSGAGVEQSAPMESLFGAPSAITGMTPGVMPMPNVNAPKDMIGGSDAFQNMFAGSDTPLVDQALTTLDTDVLSDEQVDDDIERQNAKESIARRLEMADRGLGYDDMTGSMGLESSTGLKGLMEMAMAQQPAQQQSPMNQSQGYANKYIQGLLGGM